MANFEIVSPYTHDLAAWLEGEGCLHPPVRPGNRMPTTADMKWALEVEDEFEFDYPQEDGELYGTDGDGQGLSIAGFDWDYGESAPEKYFTVRGSEVILPALIRLTERCGQLYVYPDSGAPPIVLEPGLDVQAVVELYAEACEREDGLAYFFKQMYGPGGLATA